MKENRERLLEIVKYFAGRRVLVVGDIIIDHFIWGVVDRISPEAPVPVVLVDREEVIPGGAANVARNLLSLGARVELAGVIGKDEASDRYRTCLRQHGIGAEYLIEEEDRPTTVKTRVVAHNQQVVRFDRETDRVISVESRKKLMKTLGDGVSRFDAVIVSDYGKGVINRRVMDRLRESSRKYDIPICVDPKIRNASHYRNVDMMTPNHHEAGQILGIKLANEDAAVEAAGQKLVRKLGLKCLLITRAARGMSIFQPRESPTHIPTVARQVFDVTGAGDSVIAAITLARISGASWVKAAEIANFAAGVVVGKVGTATASLQEVRDAIRRYA